MAPPGLTLAALTGDAEFELTAGWAQQTVVEDTAELVRLMSEESLAESESRSLANGVPVESALWDRLQALAVIVLVPASEESRARGAG